jgi:hypothetical protein
MFALSMHVLMVSMYVADINTELWNSIEAGEEASKYRTERLNEHIIFNMYAYNLSQGPLTEGKGTVQLTSRLR